MLVAAFIMGALPAQAIAETIDQVQNQYALDKAREELGIVVEELPIDIDLNDYILPMPEGLESQMALDRDMPTYEMDALGAPLDAGAAKKKDMPPNQLMSYAEKETLENAPRSGIQAAAATTDADSLKLAPFSYQYLDYEKINLNTGALVYEQTHAVIPGRNGFDLELGIRYDSDNALTTQYDGDNNSTQYYRMDVYRTEAVVTSYLRQNGSIVPNTTYTSYNINAEVMSSYDRSFSDAQDRLNAQTGTYTYPNFFGYGVDLVQVVTGTVDPTYLFFRYRINAPTVKNYKYADLGVGWHFNFSYLELEISPESNLIDYFTLHRNDGVTEKAAWDTSQNKMLHGTWSGHVKNVERNPASPIAGLSPKFLITYTDGSEDYFFANGRLMLSRDRYGNAIRFEYNTDEALTRITDSAGRVVNIGYTFSGTTKYVTVTMPDNSTIQYTLERVLTNQYQLVSVRDQMGQVTTYTHEADSLLDRFYADEDGIYGWFLNSGMYLTSVTYPTGARSEYTYVRGRYHTGNQREFDVKRIASRKDIINATDVNTYNYEYLSTHHDAIYKRVHGTDGVPQLMYGTYVTDGDGVTQSYFFGDKGLIRQATTMSSTLKTVSLQENGAYQQPVKVHQKTYGSTTTPIERIELFEYGSWRTITAYWSPLSEGQKTAAHKVAYTYHDTYNYLLTKTYQTDASTIISEIYTPSSDGKSIASAIIKQNNVQKAKTDYTYDGYGQVTSIKAYRDNFVDFAETGYVYDTYGNVTSQYQTNIKASDGAILTTSGLPSGRVGTRSIYDIMGRLTSVYNDRGRQTRYAYNALGQVTQITHPDDTRIAYARNYTQNTLTITDEVNTQTRYSYNPLGYETQIWDITGNRQISQKTYDNQMRLKTEQGAAGTAVVTYGYDAFDRVTFKVARNGNTVVAQESYVYDDGDPLGQKVTQILHGSGTIAPNQVSVSYTDKLGQVVRAGRIYNGPVVCATYEYDYIGRKISEKSAQAYAESWDVPYTSKWEYTFDNQISKVYNALGQYTQFTYLNTAAAGKQIRSYDYAGVSGGYYSTATYDDLGRLIKGQTPVVKNGNTIYYSQSEYNYGIAGYNDLLFQMRKQNGAPGQSNAWQETMNSYNSRGFLIQSNLFTNGSITEYYKYAYDNAGRMLSMTDALNHVTRYQYDARGQLIKLTDALGQVESYGYDASGLMVSKTDRNGAQHTWNYDALGRETEYAVDGVYRNTQYSPLGQLLRVENETSVVMYQYDALGRKLLEFETSLDGTTAHHFSYNTGDLRTGMVLTTGGASKTTIYTYDRLGRLTGVSQPGTSASYAYDTNGNRATLTVGNVTTSYTYNLANWITEIRNMVGGNIHSRYSYSYLLDGNQASKTDHVKGEIVSYTYTAQGRLSEESYAEGLAITGAVTYTYDGAGNRASMTDTRDGTSTTAYTYDANNRLLGTEQAYTSGIVRQSHYTYDGNGNQLGRRNEMLIPEGLAEGPTGVGFNGSYQINSWNAAGQLVAVDNDLHSATYTYNPSGLRHSKVANGVTSVHAWDGGDMVAERINNQRAWYVRGLGLLWSEDNSGKSIYAYNAHGDVVGLIGANGQDYSYDAFGNQLNEGVPIGLMTPAQASADRNPFRYCGEYFDLSSGYYYLRARYYDPATSRMLSEDPIRAGLNWYVYCNNNPIARIDPSGLDSYILYDPNDNGFVSYEKAAAMAKELETMYDAPCHLIPITSRDGLVDAWNNQVGFGANGNAVSIDATAIYAHGSATDYGFKGKKTGSFVNRNDWFFDSDISKLDQKTMELFISISCNTGYPNGSNPNIATEIMKAQQGIKYTLASDGTVYAPSTATTTTTGMWFWKKTVTTTQVSLYTDSDRADAAGYKLYSRNNNGGITASTVGGLGYVFKGLTGLINMALNK